MDTILIPADRAPLAYDLFHGSALHDCAHFAANAHHTPTQLKIIRADYGLSSGEELLWAVLAWLCDTGPLPPLRQLESQLDHPNFVAVRRVLGSVGQR